MSSSWLVNVTEVQPCPHDLTARNSNKGRGSKEDQHNLMRAALSSCIVHRRLLRDLSRSPYWRKIPRDQGQHTMLKDSFESLRSPTSTNRGLLGASLKGTPSDPDPRLPVLAAMQVGACMCAQARGSDRSLGKSWASRDFSL